MQNADRHVQKKASVAGTEQARVWERMESKEEARIGSERQLKEVDSCSKCNEIPRVVFKQGSDMV